MNTNYLSSYGGRLEHSKELSKCSFPFPLIGQVGSLPVGQI